MTAPANPFTGRQIVYTQQVPFENDVLYTNLYKMMDIGIIALSTLMPSPTLQASNPNNYFLAYNLLCTPTSPASLSVNIGPGGGSGLGSIGALFGYVPVDATDYGVISTNTTDNIFKPFIQTTSNSPVVVGPITNSLTAGQSVYYLLEAQPITSDSNNQSRPFFNAANPQVPIFQTNPQTRIDYIQYQFKMGTPTTGTPTPPSADSGWVPLYNILLTFGQTSITSGDISVNASAPFITESLTQKISQASGDIRYLQASALQNSTPIFITDSSVVANSIVALPSPAYGSYTQATTIWVIAANTNTGPTTINISSVGSTNVKKKTPIGKAALVGGEYVAGQIYQLIYDGSDFILLNPSSTSNYQWVLSNSGLITNISATPQIVSWSNSDYSDPYGVITNPNAQDLTPQVSGQYAVEAIMNFAVYTHTINIQARISGVLSKQLASLPPNADAASSISGTCILSLTAGSPVSIWVSASAGNTGKNNTGVTLSQFSLKYLGV